jgi:WXG100 family type VII secretion target
VAGYEVTPAELQWTARVLRQIGTDARLELARLDADATALIDGGWQGSAALAFGRGWTLWHTGAAEVLGALDAMAGLLDASGVDYDVAETTCAGELSQALR